MRKFLLKNKKSVTFIATLALCLAIGVVAFAADGTADATVTAAFTGISADLKATMGVVAGVAVGIMGVFLAWKYGRKLFSTVAK